MSDMSEDELNRMQEDDNISTMQPITYVVLIPYKSENHICVGHFGSRVDAARFIGKFTSRVEIPAEAMMVGPVYSHADIMDLIDEKGVIDDD